MSEPILSWRQPAAHDEDELQLEGLTQEIDAPLGDLLERRDEPTLSTLDFEDIANALDW